MAQNRTIRLFRLFLSSTFSDFIAEREALQSVVIPELEQYCAERSARFQLVDLRWGITEEAQREHDTMRICLEEVRRCQQLSPRPNFAVLLGDRYGWEPVPARIPRDHWQRLKVAANTEDWKLISSSYRLDKNAIPPVYCLRVHEIDQAVAFQTESQLLRALRRAARGFRGRARYSYFASATHQEIMLGALPPSDEQGPILNPAQHVHVYVRHLSGLPKDISAKKFIDWDENQQCVVPGARERLENLKRQLCRHLGDHVHDLQTSWRNHGQNDAVDKAYLHRFCNEFLKHQKQLIDSELSSVLQNDEFKERERAHQDFGIDRARVFSGRKALLSRIARYATTKNDRTNSESTSRERRIAPLIVMGDGGSGKSALIARSAQNSCKQAKRSDAIVFQRYIGGVPGTESLMTMINDLAADITRIYGQPVLPNSEDTKTLAEAFVIALSYASAKRPLIVYLDALDQLDGESNAWMLEWLPKELPEHVRVVASVRSGTISEHSARLRYPISLVDVPPMNSAEGQAMLRACLTDKRSAWFNAGIVPSRGRLLTRQQQEAVLTAFRENGSALWLKLASEEAATWASWETPRKLPTSLQGLIEDLVNRRLLAKEKHPKAFTIRSLAYITAGRFGLAEEELNNALATDRAVRLEFEAQNEKTGQPWAIDLKNPRLPPILWSRLYFDLQPYLTKARVEGTIAYRWFHREFKAEISKRLVSRDTHQHLANNFKSLDLRFANNVSEGTSPQLARRAREEPFHREQAKDDKGLLDSYKEIRICKASIALDKFEFLRHLMRLKIEPKEFFRDYVKNSLIREFLHFAKGEEFHRDFGSDLVAVGREAGQFGTEDNIFERAGYKMTGRALFARLIPAFSVRRSLKSDFDFITPGAWQFLIRSEFSREGKKNAQFYQMHFPRYLMANCLRQQDHYFTSENYEEFTRATWFPFAVLIRGRNKLTFLFDDTEFDLQESFVKKMKADLILLESAIEKLAYGADEIMKLQRIKTLSGKIIYSQNEDLLRAIAFESVVLGRNFRRSRGIFKGYCLLDEWNASKNTNAFASNILQEQLQEDPSLYDPAYIERLQRLQIEVFGEIIWGKAPQISPEKVTDLFVNGINSLQTFQKGQLFLMRDIFEVSFLHLLLPILGKESFSDFVEKICRHLQPDSQEEQQARIGIAYIELLGNLINGSSFN